MNLPIDFIERTKPLLGEQWESFLNALQGDAPVSIRINKDKAPTDSKMQGVDVLWCDNGYYLSERPSFTFDPLFHAGCYYVQEASSMFVEQAIKQYAGSGIKVLDLCAAPGGKSTLLASLLDEGSLLVSNEVIRSRANILAENLMKWGNPNVVITNNDPSKIGKLDSFFDVILVDAPCSGEGMFRKDEGAIAEWSVDNVQLCEERQQRILADIWPSLKSGGLLIYSTCTYNKEENEDNVRWIRENLGAESLPIDLDEEWGITPSYYEDVHGYHFFPHRTKGEGFFLSVLRKDGEASDEKVRNRKKNGKDRKPKQDITSEYKNYLQDNERFTFYPKGDSWCAFPTALYEDLSLLSSNLNIISEGICLGEVKGKDLVPDQSLALSNCLNQSAFPICEVDWKTAISYLRKEALILDNQPKGYILLTYRNQPLGFVKNIGNRANNLYPQEWRIRSANIPAEEVRVI